MDTETTVTASAPQDTTPAPATETTPQATNTSTESTASNESTSSTSSNEGGGNIATVSNEEGKPKYVLYEDESGQRRLKLAEAESASAPTETQAEESQEQVDTNAQTDAESTAATAQNVGEELAQPLAPYSLSEFTQALTTGNVDESRIPAEYVPQYAQYKIAQAIEAQKQQAELAKQQQAELEKKLTPEEQQANMQAFLEGLDKEAAKRAAVDAGLTEDDLANMDFMDENDQKAINFKLFKEWHRTQLMGELQQRAAVETTAREKQAAIYQDINKFVAEAKASEPNFDAIDKMMNTRFQTLPYEQGKKIEAVYAALKAGNITEAQTVELRKYYENCKKEYYAKKTGLSTTPKPVAKPPVVERAGNGEEIHKEYVPDYKALRANSDPRAKRAWLAEFLRNKGR